MHKSIADAALWLAAIVDISDDAIISENLDGNITTWNRAAQDIFGWTEEEAIGQSLTIIIASGMREEETQIPKRLSTGERIDHLETVGMTKTGAKVNISLTISPVKDSEGRVVGVATIARDVTELKLAAAVVKASHDQLERRIRE